ncbi:MAG: His-Xaa-Ser system protein HxsD [Phycisphaerae bacterium]|nr:His-Xaa-Ser system protein HxsD [Phycisphaerae bacterium]MDD5380568.1 His-Xaa-Ser system protein HxsD [Phycisphaerae bacterium]
MSENPNNKKCKVLLNRNIYSLISIKKAAYKFGDKYYIEIDEESQDEIAITFEVKNANVSFFNIGEEFYNEVLDQELRELVSEETKDIRNILLAQAFSATSLIDQEGDDANYRLDPKKIASFDA